MIGARVNACDREEKYEELLKEFADNVWVASVNRIFINAAETFIEITQNSPKRPSRLQILRLHNLQR